MREATIKAQFVLVLLSEVPEIALLGVRCP